MRYIDPAQKLFKHLDVLAAIKDGEQPAPVNVEIDLTNRCNLGCDDCHFAHTHTRGPLASRPKPENMLDVGDQMDVDLITNVLYQMKTMGVQSVTWTGGGEPTLHPKFDYIIEYTNLHRAIPQGIYTNGTMIDQNRANLMKRHMRWVYVSLDRHTRQLYKDYKKTDAFDRAIGGIQNLVRAEGKATVGVGFLLDQHSWGYGNMMIELASELGADYVQFRPTIEFDFAQPNKRKGDNSWIKPAMQWLEGVSGLKAGRTLVVADTKRFAEYRNWHDHGYPVCYWTQLQCVITPNGKVWRCVNRRGMPGDCIGDLNVEPFYRVWERSAAFVVTPTCRVMCRGHVPNKTLDQVMAPTDHEEFI